MTVHVAVMDPLPVFRRGVAAALSSLGYLVEEPADAVAWSRERPGGLVLLTLQSAEDLDRLTALCHPRPRPLVVALLSGEHSSSLGVGAIRAGARSVLAREAPVYALQRVVSATLDGEAVMPADLADLLLAERGRPRRRLAPPAQQVVWLRRLADGWTVARLASEIGYSERAMYRLLQGLYRQIGVSSRLEAIILAQKEGWFED